MATSYPSASTHFGVGSTGSSTGGTSYPDAAPYSGTADDPTGTADTKWWEALLGTGRFIFDELTYTAEERARDEYADKAHRRTVEAQQTLAAQQQQAQAANTKLMLYGGAAIAGVIAVAVVAS